MKMFTRSLCLVAALTSTMPAFADDKTAASGENHCVVFKRKQLTDVELRGADGKSRGEIDGVLVDTSSGTIRYALVGTGGVLGVGEKEHLIPWEAIDAGLDKDGEKCVARTSLTQEQIDAAPTFRKEVVIDSKLERAARKSVGLSDEPRGGFAQQLILASDLEGALVRSADGKDLGKIDTVVIAPQNAGIAYLVLGAGGVLGLGEKEYALPWGTVEVTTNKENKTELRTKLTKETLQQAPEYDKGDWKRMSSASWMEDLCKHHSVPFFCSRSSRSDG